MTPPRSGTVLRVAWDAAHKRWCGDNCLNGPSCAEWNPDKQELQAVIDAVRAFERDKAVQRINRLLAAEQRTLGVSHE